MSYVTVFEVAHEAVPLWIPFTLVIFSLFAAIFILLTNDTPILRTVVKVCVFLFACLWAAFVAYTFHHRHLAVKAYQDGEYKVVEGTVHHYSWNGKHECFSVRAIEFCHGTANAIGWDPPLRFGPTTWPVGSMRDGSPVRVAYSQGEYPRILRLEIARNSR